MQKSGTTYLQQMMQDRTRELAAINVLYPVPPRMRSEGGRLNHHETATYGLLGTEYPWVSEERAAKEKAWWASLRKQVRDWSGTAVVSAEALSVVRADAARRTVEEFGVPENTDVFITGRGLGRLLPSVWQQHVRNGHATSYDRYLRQLAQQRDRGWAELEEDPRTHLWRAFALGRLAQRWAGIVGPDRVTLITNPGSPADRLWHRFLEAVQLGDTSGLPAPDTATTVHSGVTAPEAEVLRSVNGNLVDAGMDRPSARRLRSQVIEGFAAREKRGPRLGVRSGFRDRVAGWSQEDIADLHESKVRIVGDVAELHYDPEAEPAEPTPAEIAEAAGVAVRAAADWTPSPREAAKTR
ncbi:hypothetical protein ACFPZ0_25250 [Streptomonospora nanhaiensis]|uniref:Sulfotransferase family protein n=1 Tax=Streptomonospora nanhaiensis TaxID=1323731 RepID=A0A853BNE5_9ACTN|nr:hypothetical protein [Streptomonospora nanhaiensis]NYI95972.1 hypothetical protein [Streptomonospora nanhaiensis]